MNIHELLFSMPKSCPCGRAHVHTLKDILIGQGVVRQLPALLGGLGASHPYVLTDQTTERVAGGAVCRILTDAGLSFVSHTLPSERPIPNEAFVGSAILHLDMTCDAIVAVGSGVVNDIAKIVSHTTGRPFIIVATAPSMDGYASDSSSMERDGLKVSVKSRCADVIIGDTDILSKAPERMLISGIGDMLAKYVSLCEWHISHLVNGEYYCEYVASLVREALKRCVEHADGLLRRDPRAIEAVFSGLVIGGVAMTYAGLSRPASGVEHYVSHILDMRGLSRGTPVDLHGIQCAIGTRYALHVYDRLRKVRPDADKARRAVSAFDYAAHAEALRAFIGEGAEAMIEGEKREKKYDPLKHERRLATLIDRWDDILAIMGAELPSEGDLVAFLDRIGAPKSFSDIALPEGEVNTVLTMTKDIRDKYVLTSLLWDLGLTDELIG